MNDSRQSGPVSALPSKQVRPGGQGVAKKWLIVILGLAFAFVLMPFLLWYMTTFSRPLSADEMTRFFAPGARPRDTQHALSRVADEMLNLDPGVRASAKQWYPDVLRAAQQDGEEVRLTAAWVMGQDNTAPDFHAALLDLVHDPNPMVRRNAALALVRFADDSGHDTIVSMLAPFHLPAPHAGALAVRLRPGDAINPGTLLAHINAGGAKIEVRSQVPGTIQGWLVPDGAQVAAGQPIVLVDSSSDVVWEALRALYLIGRKDDLPLVTAYARGVEGMPPNIQEQAKLTLEAIQSRAAAPAAQSASPH